MTLPQPKKTRWLLASLIALTLAACGDKPAAKSAPPAKPALTVTVTTPQEVALHDVRKGMMMFQKVNVPLLGIV